MTEAESIVARGQKEALARRVEEEQRRLAWQIENMKHVEWWLRFQFYRDPAYRIANPDRGAWQRTVENPDHPYPQMTNWEPLDLRESSTRGASHFDCDGVHWVVRWVFKGRGGDPADWDDGWWPDWFVVVSRPRKWLPFLRHDVEVQVWGAEQVAAAVNG